MRHDHIAKALTPANDIVEPHGEPDSLDGFGASPWVGVTLMFAVAALIGAMLAIGHAL